MAPSQKTSRSAALSILTDVLGEGKLVSEVMAEGVLSKFQGPERARAQRLVQDTLRNLERLDKVLSRALRKKPPLRAMNILRMATLELVQGGDAHGIVNEAVSLTAAHKKTAHMKGLVNAVLRKLSGTVSDEWPKLRVPRLPNWLRKPLVSAYGGDVVHAIEAAHYVGAPLDITPRSVSDADRLAQVLGGEVILGRSIRITDQVQVTALPEFEKGTWWVQDAAAALPVGLLGDLTGKTALDLCAAPGGKTLQLSAQGAKVTSVDISQTRLGRVQENLERTGLVADVQQQDALDVSGQYDVVLLDAPCSATGTIRRHPDLPHAKNGSNFGALINLQAQMLAHAATLVTEGGLLVYCTCSLLPDEGECQVEEFLDMFPEFHVDRSFFEHRNLEQDWITEEGGLRLRPDFMSSQGGLDGFYVAYLRKTQTA